MFPPFKGQAARAGTIPDMVQPYGPDHGDSSCGRKLGEVGGSSTSAREVDFSSGSYPWSYKDHPDHHHELVPAFPISMSLSGDLQAVHDPGR